MDKITSESVKDEILKSQKKRFHRNKSWEHCYIFFRKYKHIYNDKELTDKAALHLGFFLASFGMLRGSSFLIKRDYKFYIPIINILFKNNYGQLWSVEEIPNEEQIELIFCLKQELEKEIENLNRSMADNVVHQTDMIISKIMMGTIGLVPGYDRFFIKGVKKEGHNLKFSKESFRELINMIKDRADLKNVWDIKVNIKESEYKYPPFKLVDIYFWLKGYENEK